MPILVFQHHDIGGPGRLGATLRDLGHRLDIVRPDLNEPMPADLDGVEGIVSLGGPQNVDVQQANPTRWPWMVREMELLKEAHSRSLPIIGVCLGHQMLAAALGGEIAPLGVPQMGFHDVSLTPVAHTDPIFAGIAWTSPQFCVNGREVTKAPPVAAVLASSKSSKVMCFRVGLRSYGFQHHFECEREMIDLYHAEDAAGFGAAGLQVGGPGSPAAKQADGAYPTFGRLADRLCQNLATFLFPPRFRELARKDMAEGSAAIGAGR